MTFLKRLTCEYEFLKLFFTEVTNFFQKSTDLSIICCLLFKKHSTSTFYHIRYTWYTARHFFSLLLSAFSINFLHPNLYLAYTANKRSPWLNPTNVCIIVVTLLYHIYISLRFIGFFHSLWPFHLILQKFTIWKIQSEQQKKKHTHS